jgi:hypothetical protein
MKSHRSIYEVSHFLDIYVHDPEADESVHAEDLNHCAICEVSGMIILGARSGELQILRV